MKKVAMYKVGDTVYRIHAGIGKEPEILKHNIKELARNLYYPSSDLDFGYIYLLDNGDIIHDTNCIARSREDLINKMIGRYQNIVASLINRRSEVNERFISISDEIERVNKQIAILTEEHKLHLSAAKSIKRKRKKNA